MEIKDDSLAQNLFDYMFKDFENNLREMGFGDVAVNKKMKVFDKMKCTKKNGATLQNFNWVLLESSVLT